MQYSVDRMVVRRFSRTHIVHCLDDNGAPGQYGRDATNKIGPKKMRMNHIVTSFAKCPNQFHPPTWPVTQKGTTIEDRKDCDVYAERAYVLNEFAALDNAIDVHLKSGLVDVPGHCGHHLTSTTEDKPGNDLRDSNLPSFGVQCLPASVPRTAFTSQRVTAVVAFRTDLVVTTQNRHLVPQEQRIARTF